MRSYRPSTSNSFLRLGRLISTTAAAVVVLGCGGVGTGGTGAFSSAFVTGFASVFVGDVEFNDAQAVVIDDDGAAVGRDGNEVRLGMTVEAVGSGIVAAGAAKSSVASTLRIATSVVGTVDAIDTNARTLTVLGQQLQADAATVFGPSLRGGLSALRLGDIVAVYGFPDAVSGRYLATRIEPAPGVKAFRLRGIVSALDPAARTLRIGAATLSYSSALAVPQDLAIGQFVRVRLPATNNTGTLLRIDAFGASSTQPPEGDTVTLEGLVTSFGNVTSFSVNGLAIDARQAQFVSNAPLAAGAYAKIEGRIVNGIVLATSAKILPQSAIDAFSYRVAGPISGLDVVAKSFIVRGVSIDYSNAQFVNGSVTSLVNAAFVRADGPLSSDGTQIRASQISFR